MATTPGSSADLRRRTALVVLVIASLIAAVWTIWPDPKKPEPVVAATPPAPQTVERGTTLHPSVCGNPARKPFVPTRISIDQVAKDAQVLALPRDANNVPQ